MSQVKLKNQSRRLVTLNNKIDGKNVKYKLLPAGKAVRVDKDTASLVLALMYQASTRWAVLSSAIPAPQRIATPSKPNTLKP